MMKRPCKRFARACLSTVILATWALGHAVAASAQGAPAATAPPATATDPPPLLAAAAAAAAPAQPALPPLVPGRRGKLLLTSGVSSIDGAAGGGLTPWAVTGGYATDGSIGSSAFFTRTVLRDYALNVYGVAVAWGDRAEASIARQDFNTGDSIAPLGFPGLRLKQTIVGLKVRVAGDAILDSDSLVPQIAVGIEYKDLDAGRFKPVLQSLGARAQGTDFYLSATKLFLAQSVLLNGTLRATRANQNGLLGFGSARRDNYRLQPEVSLALALRRDLVIGVEYRAQPNNLNGVAFGRGLRANDWKDAFIAWTPAKWFSLTVAYVDLGRIVPVLTPKRQTGAYVSAQFSY